MGWYDKGLQVSPYLVSMTGGVGKGLASFGNSLVNLGDQKIKKADKDAAEKRRLAKIKAQAKYNKTVNPDMATTFGDKGLGLVQFTAPTDKRKIVSQGSTIVGADGKAIYTNKKPQVGFTLSEGQKRFGPDGKLIASSSKTKPGFTLGEGQKRFDANGKQIASSSKTQKAPTQRTVNENGKNVIQQYIGGKWVTSANAPIYNQSAKVNQTKGLKSTGGLSGAQIMYARDNNLTKNINGKEYVPEKTYKKLIMMDQIGNTEVK